MCAFPQAQHGWTSRPFLRSGPPHGRCSATQPRSEGITVAHEAKATSPDHRPSNPRNHRRQGPPSVRNLDGTGVFQGTRPATLTSVVGCTWWQSREITCLILRKARACRATCHLPCHGFAFFGRPTGLQLLLRSKGSFGSDTHHEVHLALQAAPRLPSMGTKKDEDQSFFYPPGREAV